MSGYDRAQAIQFLTQYVYGPDAGDTNQDYLNEIEATLLGYSDELLDRLSNGMSVGWSELDRVEYLISDGEKGAGVSEALYFLGLVQRPRDSYIFNAAAGLHITPALPRYEDYSTADELIRQQCVALVQVAVAIMDSPPEEGGEPPLIHKPMGVRYATAIRDENLIRLVMDHPEDHARITNIIRDRKTTNVEVITDVFNSEVQALAEGSL